MTSPRRQRHLALGALLGCTALLTLVRLLPVGTPPIKPQADESRACASAQSHQAFLELPVVRCDAQGPADAPGRVQLLMGTPLDLNHASARDLSDLPGVGPRLAERMVKHREEHGPFPNVEALGGVRGVGEKTLARLAPYLRAE